MGCAYISSLSSRSANVWPRRLTVLGCTGSIGASTLDIAERNPDALRVVALGGGRNAQALARQANRFRPAWVGVQDEETAESLLPLLAYRPMILIGQAGYEQLAALEEADMVVSAQAGASGLRGTVAAARAGKLIALANKESLVLAGPLLRRLCAASGAVILPVDSEHNAIFQCLSGQDWGSVTRLFLTASGGPFRGMGRDALARVTPREALAHPRWRMGKKISIDSATMMNKGLELIEAHVLFGIAPECIEVLVHPQSVVHSLVEFLDRGQLGQLGQPDMRIPISTCLAWPGRIVSGAAALDLTRTGPLTFEHPDDELFPCLSLARKALSLGNGAAIRLSGANEVAVEAFLEGRIGFLDIPACLGHILETAEKAKREGEAGLDMSVGQIEKLDAQARDAARKWILTCSRN